MSAMMYDIWTIFNKKSKPYFLNKNNNGVYIQYDETSFDKENEKALHEAIVTLPTDIFIIDMKYHLNSKRPKI